MKVVDDAVLAVTGFKRQVMQGTAVKIVEGPSSAGIGFDVWDGQTRITRAAGNPLEPVVVTHQFPYAVYYSNPGSRSHKRLSGENDRATVYFGFRGIGVTREQAQWVMEQLQLALADQRLVVPGHKAWPTSLEQSNRIFRDDEAVQPNGGPVFYGEDYYAASITLTRGRGAA